MPDPLNYTIEHDRYRIFLCALGPPPLKLRTGKQEFHPVNFFKQYILIVLCPWQESNLRPSGPQPDALSTELQGHILFKKKLTGTSWTTTRNPLLRRAGIHRAEFIRLGRKRISFQTEKAV